MTFENPRDPFSNVHGLPSLSLGHFDRLHNLFLRFPYWFAKIVFIDPFVCSLRSSIMFVTCIFAGCLLLPLRYHRKLRALSAPMLSTPKFAQATSTSSVSRSPHLLWSSASRCLSFLEIRTLRLHGCDGMGPPTGGVQASEPGGLLTPHRDSESTSNCEMPKRRSRSLPLVSKLSDGLAPNATSS